jgi:hypothetical protein
MKRRLLISGGVAAAACLAWGFSVRKGGSQPLPPNPEHTLLGIRLGRSFVEVRRLYGGPDDVLTVAVPGSVGTPIAGGPEGGMPGGDMFGGGLSGPPGGSGGVSAAAGGLPPPPGFFGSGGGTGSPFGPPVGGSGGVPVLPPASGGGGIPGMPGMSGGGMAGKMGALGGAEGPGGPAFGSSPTGPEYSQALLWLYRRAGGVRLEFLMNEDGRVAQISVAAPVKAVLSAASRAAGKKGRAAGGRIPAVTSLRGLIPVRTSKRITLGSSYADLLDAYGFPEKTRRLAGARFEEAYYTKNYHCAFTVDALAGRRVVRITVTLAD